MCTGERQSARIRAKYLRAILRQEVAYFEKGHSSTAEVVSNVSADTLLVQEAMSEKVRHSNPCRTYKSFSWNPESPKSNHASSPQFSIPILTQVGNSHLNFQTQFSCEWAIRTSILKPNSHASSPLSCVQVGNFVQNITQFVGGYIVAYVQIWRLALAVTPFIPLLLIDH